MYLNNLLIKYINYTINLKDAFVLIYLMRREYLRIMQTQNMKLYIFNLKE
jgi:hypothetical protein